MKGILALAAVLLVFGGAWLYKAARPAMLYGEFVGAPKAPVAALLAKPQAYSRNTVAIEGIITQQCTTMGCYFFFESGETLLRVDLAEIAMHAPKKRNGKPARVEGRMVPYGDGWQFWASAVEFK